MSKMDGLRAMREAHYAEAAKRVTKPTAAPRKTERPAPEPAEATRSAATPEPPQALGVLLCGHRAISGRTCTREHGHAVKSHRYS